jgi:hypothetical protein
MTQRIQFKTFRISPWQLWLAGAVGFALTAAIVVVAAGLLLILAPIALVAGLIYRLKGGQKIKPGDPREIEVDYTVVKNGPDGGKHLGR